MAQEFTQEKLEQFIQACISEQDVPESDLQTLEEIMSSQSQKAKEVAMRLLDESMIRSWFRSQADSSFINEVQRRLNIRFQDQEFIQAVMHRVKENIDANEGDPGATLHKDPVKSVSMLRYILVPLCAALLYISFVHHETIMNFFSDSESTLMTVEDFNGQPTVISSGKSKGTILKQIIRPGDTLNTEKNQTFKLRYPDESTLEIHQSSSLVAVDNNSQKTLQILRGTLKASIKKQKESLPFSVKTSFGELLVIYGDVLMQLTEDSTTVKVLKNNATFIHPATDKTVKIRLGQTAEIDNSGIKILEQSQIK
ncbi:MAG: FecR family protein [Lentisphaerales bacterium]|nr:FecR family protein [Lentisphaerales bacterium]